MIRAEVRYAIVVEWRTVELCCGLHKSSSSSRSGTVNSGVAGTSWWRSQRWWGDGCRRVSDLSSASGISGQHTAAVVQRRGEDSSLGPGRRRESAAEDVHQGIFVLCYVVTRAGPGLLDSGRMLQRTRRYLYPFAISGPVPARFRLMHTGGANCTVCPSTRSTDAPVACKDFVLFPLSAIIAVVIANTCR
ncbi:Piso0_000161 [Millerozyma farinosa CBS 7064]|uniref:Piso0_000161 protein n=1 Tax=Pichia sorbitophila (strain ATCC MYA-4447 / BCRC 22081 / CBS 7064 / NBRC 10061 / NRRL Y-12695) TaxID=559304 RepID=G8YT89_PICSO|nr:Piso0_000161 [Millerozyma farinosa CBS 7064]